MLSLFDGIKMAVQAGEIPSITCAGFLCKRRNEGSWLNSLHLCNAVFNWKQEAPAYRTAFTTKALLLSTLAVQ